MTAIPFTVDAIKVGSTSIDFAYVGTDQVFDGSVYSPLTAVSWASAFWAEDPDWTNPGDGNEVTSWRDAGSNAADAAKVDANGPAYLASVAAFGGKPGIDISSSSSRGRLQQSGAIATQPGTFATIVLWDDFSSGDIIDGVTNRWLLDRPSTTGLIRVFAGTSVNTTINSSAGVSVILWDVNGASSSLYVNGTTQTGLSPGSASLSNTLIGGTNSTATPGTFAFFGVTSGALMTTDEKTAFVEWAFDYYGAGTGSL